MRFSAAAKKTKFLMAIVFLRAAIASATPPPNDDFANAQAISGDSGAVSGSNVDATKQAYSEPYGGGGTRYVAEPDHAGNPGGASVWYAWTAPSDGSFNFDTFGSSFDTLLAVYTTSGGNTLGDINFSAGSNDDAAGLQSVVSFYASANTVYYIAVDGYFGDTGSVTLNWSPQAPPPVAGIHDQIPDSEYQALVAFYNNTGGQQWITSTGWLDPTAPVWFGVTVSGVQYDTNGGVISTGHVMALNLPGNHLNGDPGDSVAALTALVTFSLPGNTLAAIPAALGQLQQLQFIDLSSGATFPSSAFPAIPPELGNAANLQTLNLASSAIGTFVAADFGGFAFVGGSIPPELGKLANLKKLNLNGTTLRGTIPKELGNLANLEELDLSAQGYELVGPNYGFTGSIPAELGQLAKLRRLNLASNNLSGEIPHELGNLTNLQKLYVDHNALTGSIPKQFGQLTNLRILSVGNIDDNDFFAGFTSSLHNQLTGEIPAELATLPHLEELYLGTNTLSGALPIGFGSLDHLRILDATSNRLTGQLPQDLGMSSSLKGIYLYNNHLGGSIPPSLGSVPSLVVLALQSNELDGAIPAELGNLANLIYLGLFSNRLSGPIPPELGNLGKLGTYYVGNDRVPLPAQFTGPAFFSLANNRLSGDIPKELANLADIQIVFPGQPPQAALFGIDLSSNQLTGSIPPGLSKFFGSVDIHSNRLSGEIPAQFGNSTVLNLILNDDALTGQIPVELGNAPYLGYLNLSNNQLSGAIPGTLSTLKLLSYLNLSGNQLSGEIPSDLYFVPFLQTLDLSSNQLVGQLPANVSFAKSSLAFLNLSFNQLSGSIPAAFGSFPFPKFGDLQLLLAGNQFSGPIPPELGTLGVTTLDLSNNRLTGNIPATFGNLQRIDVLDLSNNALSGTVPAELGDAVTLTALYLDSNKLSGPIPPKLGNLKALRYLYLNTNRLTGLIPAALGNLRSLKVLDLHQNLLTGAIPTELSHLGALETLNLSDNQLSGDISATSLGAMTNLQELNLSYNYLSGAVSQSFTNFNRSAELDLRENRLDLSAAGGSLQVLTLYDNAQYTPQRLAPYFIADLGTLGGESSIGLAINDKGEVTGASDTAGLAQNAFLFSGGQMQDISASQGPFGAGESINNMSQVVGRSSVGAFLFAAAAGPVLLPLDASKPLAINAGGSVAGTATNSSNEAGAAVFEDNAITFLDPASTSSDSSTAINDGGDVVTANGSEYLVTSTQPLARSKATLPTLGGSSTSANDLNNARIVVGSSKLPGDANSHAFSFDGMQMSDLGTLFADRDSTALSVNDNGEAVGFSFDGSSTSAPQHPFVFDGKVLRDLNLLIPVTSGWTLNSAEDINNLSQIVGTGVINGAQHAYRLTPVIRLLVPPATIPAGTTIPVTALVLRVTQIAEVDFFVNGSLVDVETQPVITGSTSSSRVHALNESVPVDPYLGTVHIGGGPNLICADVKDAQGNAVHSNCVLVAGVTGGDPPPTFQISNLKTGDSVDEGTTITISGTFASAMMAANWRADSADVQVVSKVALLVNGVDVAEATTSPFTLSFTPNELGTYSLQVETVGLNGLAALSAPIVVRSVITPPPTPTPKPTATPASQGAAQLLNISTRMEVLSGDNVLIGGFIVSGTSDKKVLVRGLGPSLPVSSPLADPVLELHDVNGVVAMNDNWKDIQQPYIEATGVPPDNDLESAIVATLPANNSAYTAIVRGNNGGIGVGQVEIYDLAQLVNSQLANISTRGYVDTGDNVMIGGFISGNGSGASRVIVRGIGPSLGIDGALQDPILELHDGSGTILASNDNWQDDPNAAQVQAANIAPQDARESALYMPLAPGTYTAIVRGVNNTTGIGLVEVYNLQ